MSTETLAAVHVKDEQLKSLKPVLRKWQALVEEYCNEYKNEREAPYWCGERANVSFFAGAIWRCQGKALWEYHSGKEYEEAGKKDEYPGRTDLWFACKGESYVAEAKLVEVDLATPDDQIKRAVQQALADAVNEAASNQDKSDQKLGIAFVTPYVKIRRSIGHRVERLLSLISKEVEYGALVTSFPEVTRDLKDDEGYYNPGVVMLLKRAL